jgi:hypothetical protein
MSVCATATKAPKIAVNDPTQVTTVNAPPDASISG